MRKKLVVLTMVVAITLIAVTPALAGHGGPGGNGGNGGGGGGGGGGQLFTLVGIVTAVDSDTITVQALNDRFAGQVLTVQVTDSTRFMQWTPTGSVPATFDAVGVGDSVNIKGIMTDGAFIASRVTVDVPLYCYP